jgi:hypothetical protein
MAAHARTSQQANAAFSAMPSLSHVLKFGLLLAMRCASERDAHAQSGCLPSGSLLTKLQRQSATCLRLKGRLSFGS